MNDMTVKPIDGDALDVRPTIKNPRALGIGIVGSGNIVEHAHIPAYQAANMRIVGITSRNRTHAEGVATRTSLPKVYDNVAELMRSPDVNIVDIALPPDYQPAVAAQAITAGKHVLAQKPLAVTFEEARELVDRANRSGVVLAVNQNGRFDPSINAARSLIRRNLLGERVAFAMQMHIKMPWQTYYQDQKYERLMILHMSVHHIDQIRWIFGNPKSAVASTRNVPGDIYCGENFASYTFEYSDGFLASSVDSGADWSSDFGIHYRILGTEASLIGEIGWPHNRKSTLKYELKKGPNIWHELTFSRSWFPDAFSATMGELMSAIEQDRKPSNSGDDNLETMRAVFAAYQSAETGRKINLADIH
jgi:predicted dehydrogenase